MSNNFVSFLIAPNRCAFCSKLIEDKTGVCDECTLIIKNLKQKEEIKIKNADKIYASYVYDDVVRQAVLMAKYKTPMHFMDYFKSNLTQDLEKIIKDEKIDMIISSPYHKSKMYNLEYDLPQLMAKHLSKKFNIENSKAIKKIKKTKKQQDLSINERETNLIGAFEMTQNVENKTILLIDDIITTGNTISYLSQLLKENKAKKIIVYSFAKAMI